MTDDEAYDVTMAINPAGISAMPNPRAIAKASPSRGRRNEKVRNTVPTEIATQDRVVPSIVISRLVLFSISLFRFFISDRLSVGLGIQNKTYKVSSRRGDSLLNY